MTEASRFLGYQTVGAEQGDRKTFELYFFTVHSRFRAQQVESEERPTPCGPTLYAGTRGELQTKMQRTVPRPCHFEFCDEEADTLFRGKHVCELCAEGMMEQEAELDGPDPHGYRDPTPEESAGWAMQDKIDMYRNEY